MDKKNHIARVILDHYHDKLDHLFDYRIPSQFQNSITTGMRVLVPFGKNNRMLEAFVMEIRSESDRLEQIKEVFQVADDEPVLSRQQIQMIKWMKKTYLCRTIEAIRCFVPNLRSKPKKTAYVRLNELAADHRQNEHLWNKAPAQQRILGVLERENEMPLKKLLAETKASKSAVEALVRKGIVEVAHKTERRDPLQFHQNVSFPEPALNREQMQALEDIRVYWRDHPANGVLLHGVTGSGKTEIYMQLIKETLAGNMDSIMLVPEISLTPQMVQRFKGRFGDLVAVLHSHLTEGEKLDEWLRIKNGEARIVIGPRSAIFAPCRALGMVIIDEEHEGSYKSEQAPRYHALEIALLRTGIENARLVAGSATPSIETYFQSLQNEMKLIRLKERATGGVLPEVTIVDMRQELRKGNPSSLSTHLSEALEECLSRGQQAILLLNRRAFATYVHCFHCGHVAQCEHCDITMKWHKKDKTLKCHYCGACQETPESCPVCGESLAFQGAGTQKAEEIIKTKFPDYHVERMDQDATRSKGAHHHILERFEAGAVNILIGTQMIAKGLDFPNVTLVGILSADTSINLPDFRASERTFQLITQVAGRAGRGTHPGRVILQTYQPEHYAIQYAARQNYEQFYDEEIQLRKKFLYPPFVKLIQITFSGIHEQQVAATANKVALGMRYMIENNQFQNASEIVMEPGPALMGKVEGRYRYTLLLRSAGISFSFLKRMVKYLLVDKKNLQVPETVTAIIDSNPQFLL